MGTLKEALGQGSSSPSAKGGAGSLAAAIGGSSQADKGGGATPGDLIHAAGKLFAHSPIGQALQVADTGRAAVVATSQQIANALDGEGVHPSEWLSDVKTHKGFGQDFAEANPNANINLKRLVGFVGDTALDPLTYTTFGASDLVKGAHLAEKEIAARALNAGMRDAADRVLEGGARKLTEEEATKLGVRTTTSFGIKGHRVEIPGMGAVSDARRAVTSPITNAVEDAWLARQASKGDALAGLQRTDKVGAFEARRVAAEAKALGKGARTSALKDLNALAREHAGVDGAAVTRAMEDPEVFAASAPAVQKAATDLRGFYDDAASKVHELTGSKVAHIENYVPHQLTDEFRQLLDEQRTSAARGNAARAAFDQNRQYRVGESWFGQVLEKGTADEMEQFAKEALGSKYVQVLKDDPWELARSYANSLPKAIRARRTIADFERLGVLKAADTTGQAIEQGTVRATKGSLHGLEVDARAADREASQAAAAAEKLRSAPDRALFGESRQAASQATRKGIHAGDAATKIADLSELADHLKSVIGEVPEVAAPDASKLTALKAELERLGSEAPAATTPQGSRLRGRTSQEIGQRIDEIGSQIEQVRSAAVAQARTAGTAAVDFHKATDVTAAGFDPSAAATALRQSGATTSADKVERLAAQLDGVTRRERGPLVQRIKDAVAAGRQEVANAADQQAAQAADGLRSLRNTVPAESVGGALATSPETVQQINALEAKRTRTYADLDKRIAKEMAATEGSSAAHSRLLGAARKAVDEEQLRFDQAAAAHASFESTVAENKKLLAKVTKQLEAAQGRRAELLVGQQEALQHAQHLAERAVAEANPDLAEIARLESVAESAVARRDKSLAGAGRARDWLAGVKTSGVQAQFQQMLDDGLTSQIKANPEMWATPEMANVVQQVLDWNTPEKVNAFFKGYDSLMSRWRAYALLNPGFHSRNWFGGMFNNSLAGVSMESNLKFAKALFESRGERGIEAITDPAVRDAFRQAEKLDVWGGHNLRDLADIQGSSSARGLGNVIKEKLGGDYSRKLDKLDPTSLDNAVLTFNVHRGEDVERVLRGPLFLDRILKGDTPLAAYEAVAKYHFLYDDLSQFETKYAKRFFSFYTWTRKNFPLQLESMAAEPGKYTRYLHAKRAIELGTTPDAGEPAYMKAGLAIHLPWTKGGNSTYLQPDMPFQKLGETLNFDQLASQVTPAIKAPAEIWANKSFFNSRPIGYQGQTTIIPTAWGGNATGALLHQLDGVFGLPKVTKDSSGNYVMKPTEAYKIEQALPLLSRLRRVAPSETAFKDRRLSSIVSTLSGIGLKTLTPDQQASTK